MTRLAALIAIVAMARYVVADVQPDLCTTPTSAAMNNSCENTISNCQSGLNGVQGLNAVVAVSLSTKLGSTLKTQLGNLLTSCGSFLSTDADLALEVLNTVLTLVATIIDSVTKLLNGILSQNDCHSKVYNAMANVSVVLNNMCQSTSTGASSDQYQSLYKNAINSCDSVNLLVIYSIIGL